MKLVIVIDIIQAPLRARVHKPAHPQILPPFILAILTRTNFSIKLLKGSFELHFKSKSL